MAWPFWKCRQCWHDGQPGSLLRAPEWSPDVMAASLMAPVFPTYCMMTSFREEARRRLADSNAIGKTRQCVRVIVVAANARCRA
jgi:hypothetical protein